MCLIYILVVIYLIVRVDTLSKSGIYSFYSKVAFRDTDDENGLRVKLAG